MKPPQRTEAERIAEGLFDKTGRQIMVGDVVKVFHFVHYMRRRHCFMFKQVLDERTWRSGSRALRISHLDQTDTCYFEACDGRQLDHYEIVQGAHDDFYDRPRHLLSQEQTDER